MRQTDYEGDFIVIEGIDGSGTTTQAKKLVEYFDEAVYTHEPAPNRFGRKVEEMISSGEYMPETIGAGFLADRMAHLEEDVIPKLKEGKVVVCDRYYHSSLTYQPALGANYEWIEQINKHALEPDITVILDVSANTGMGRMEERGFDENVFEDLDFQEEVEYRYKELARRLDENIHLVDGSGSKQEVFEEVKSVVEQNLP